LYFYLFLFFLWGVISQKHETQLSLTQGHAENVQGAAFKASAYLSPVQ